MKQARRASIFLEAFALLRASAKSIAIASLVIDLIGAVANAALLAIAGRIIGLLAAEATWSDAVPWLIGSAVALAVSSVTASLHSDIVDLAAEHVGAHATTEVLKSAASVPFSSFDSPGFYDRMQRAYVSGSQSAWVIVQSTLSLIRGVFDMVAIGLVLAFVAPSLIVIAVLAYVPMWIVTRLNTKILYRFSWDETEDDRRRAYIEELLADRASAKEVRAHGLETRLVDEFTSLWSGRLGRLRSVVKATGLRSVLGYLASSVVVTFALGLVVWLTVRGDLSLDQAGVGILGVRRLSGGVNRTSSDIESLHLSGRFLSDFSAFAEEARDMSAAGSADSPTTIEALTIDDVSFCYPGATRDALSHVDLSIHAGEVTAVVGANGSGKTTLLMLLAGMYQPTDGAILWDGTDVQDLTPKARHGAVAALFQDFVQFQFTVAENVAANGDTARIEHALSLADATGFVAGLPAGIDTMLGKAYTDGTELSIGQWQRLALSRALYRDSPILLLDEPASALDPGAEGRLVARLRSSFADQIVIMISHRFASVRQADRIIVMDEGRVIEDGTHDDLVAAGGAYSALYGAQADPLLND